MCNLVICDNVTSGWIGQIAQLHDIIMMMFWGTFLYLWTEVIDGCLRNKLRECEILKVSERERESKSKAYIHTARMVKGKASQHK